MAYIEITETNARKLNPTKWVLQARLYRDGTSEVLSKFAETPAGLANIALGGWGSRNVPIATITKERATVYADVTYGARKDKPVSQHVIDDFKKVYLGTRTAALVQTPASLEETIAVEGRTA